MSIVSFKRQSTLAKPGLSARPQKPYVIKEAPGNFFDNFYKKDQEKKVQKYTYIGDTAVPVKNGRELLRGRRLRKINVIDEK